MFAAALGYVAGDPDKGLEALSSVTERDLETARKIVSAGLVTVKMTEISSRIFLLARLETTSGTAEVEIRGRHTQISRLTVDGRDIALSDGEAGPVPEAEGEEEAALIRRRTLREMLDYALHVPAEEIGVHPGGVPGEYGAV